MAILKKISMINKGLRYKLAIAFSLMTVIPLLAFLYVVYPLIFPGVPSFVHADLVLFLSVLVSIMGLAVAKNITDSVVSLSIEVRKIASGEYERKIAVDTDDELGNLGQSINIMTQKIKSNLDELKGYGQSMKDINVEIHKKVLALSSLLQIGDIISAGAAQIDSLLSLAVEKASALFDTGYGILYLARPEGGEFVMKTSYNIDKEKLEDLVLKKDGQGVFDRVLDSRNVLKIDRATKATKDIEDFKRSLNLRSILAIPLYSDKTLLGLFVVGNRLSDFTYSSDDIDLVSVFAKHVNIAIESDLLNRKNEELITRDDLTGLFNKRYILMRLEEEIKRAIFYQRPCSLIVINLDNFKRFRDTRGELAAEEALKRIAKVIKDSTSPVGKAARMGGDEFGMLLPEKNKREAAYIAEELRKKIETANVLREGKATLTASIGVSENPIDGATADELFKRAMDAVKEAKEKGKNKIIS